MLGFTAGGAGAPATMSMRAVSVFKGYLHTAIGPVLARDISLLRITLFVSVYRFSFSFLLSAKILVAGQREKDHQCIAAKEILNHLDYFSRYVYNLI